MNLEDGNYWRKLEKANLKNRKEEKNVQLSITSRKKKKSNRMGRK